jgi:hypothetical protein
VYALHLSRDLAYKVGVAPINSTLCNTFHQDCVAGCLLDKKAHFESNLKRENTTLHEAASNGNWEAIVRLLLEGADVNAQDKDGRTATVLGGEERARGDSSAVDINPPPLTLTLLLRGVSCGQS